MTTLSNTPAHNESLRLLRPRDLAERLGVSLTTLWRWQKLGGFPTAYRLGMNSVAFDEKEITAWLASRRTEPQTKAAVS